ncbi:MAG: flagellar export chaperone FliS [Treponema sp.]|nr:flagellar export chaperone FliS [Treponema sp.]MBQ1662823.1 flagellar export chaperone FliS [Treponema sp.]MBQ2081103.1 flagellar export chaperone FliS [Treponema sp.]
MNYNSYGGYNTYREVGVKTASQGKLVVMLYQGAVLHLEEAISMIDFDNRIEACNIESFGKHIQRVQDIITELQVSLDMDKGGEIAQNLMALYIYFNKELLTAGIKHDRDKLKFIHDLLDQLRESWENAANTQANNAVKMPVDSPTISITG